MKILSKIFVLSFEFVSPDAWLRRLHCLVSPCSARSDDARQKQQRPTVLSSSWKKNAQNEETSKAYLYTIVYYDFLELFVKQKRKTFDLKWKPWLRRREWNQLESVALARPIAIAAQFYFSAESLPRSSQGSQTHTPSYDTIDSLCLCQPYISPQPSSTT